MKNERALAPWLGLATELGEGGTAVKLDLADEPFGDEPLAPDMCL